MARCASASIHLLAQLKLVEDKANGPAIISTLRNKIPGLVAVEPDGDKVARAYAVTPMMESGNVWLPHPAIAPWVEQVKLELQQFPFGQHDDDVDALTQALRRMQSMTGSRVRATTEIQYSEVGHMLQEMDRNSRGGPWRPSQLLESY